MGGHPSPAEVIYRTLALVALIVCTGLSCRVPTQHTPEPYRSDAEAGAELSRRAAAYCAEVNPELPQPTKPFISDGCSAFVDASWDVECCIEHDIKYWCGGTREQRSDADTEFGRCVSERSAGVVGWPMRAGVAVGGHPVFPTKYRWGYGRPYSGGYSSGPAD